MINKLLLFTSIGISSLFAFENFEINKNFTNSYNYNKKSSIDNNYDNLNDIKELMKENNINFVTGFIEEKSKPKIKYKIITKIKKEIVYKTKYKIKKEIIKVPQYVNNSIYFDFNSAKLNNFEKKHLDKIIKNIKKLKIKQIFIIGYADKIGTKKYNLKLSKQRSENVSNYIKNNIKNIKIILKYKGNDYTISNTKNQIDRRVDIFFSKNLDKTRQ